MWRTVCSVLSILALFRVWFYQGGRGAGEGTGPCFKAPQRSVSEKRGVGWGEPEEAFSRPFLQLCGSLVEGLGLLVCCRLTQ